VNRAQEQQPQIQSICRINQLFNETQVSLKAQHRGRWSFPLAALLPPPRQSIDIDTALGNNKQIDGTAQLNPV